MQKAVTHYRVLGQNRDVTLVDISPDAIAVMRRRFAGRDVRFVPPRAY